MTARWPVVPSAPPASAITAARLKGRPGLMGACKHSVSTGTTLHNAMQSIMHTVQRQR